MTLKKTPVAFTSLKYSNLAIYITDTMNAEVT